MLEDWVRSKTVRRVIVLGSKPKPGARDRSVRELPATLTFVSGVLTVKAFSGAVQVTHELEVCFHPEMI